MRDSMGEEHKNTLKTLKGMFNGVLLLKHSTLEHDTLYVLIFF